jgi:hypothetical protein
MQGILQVSNPTIIKLLLPVLVPRYVLLLAWQ